MAEMQLPPALASDERFKVLAQIALEAFQIDLSPLMIYLIDTVDVSVLPYLAEQFSLTEDIWVLAATESAQRAMVKSAIVLHMYKGTPWAIRMIFRLLGMGEVTIDEGRNRHKYDGTMKYDGFANYGAQSGWPVYRIRIKKLLSIRQAAVARKLLENYAPARCVLYGIDFSGATLTYNGFAKYDGTYTYGGV